MSDGREMIRCYALGVADERKRVIGILEGLVNAEGAHESEASRMKWGVLCRAIAAVGSYDSEEETMTWTAQMSRK